MIFGEPPLVTVWQSSARGIIQELAVGLGEWDGVERKADGEVEGDVYMERKRILVWSGEGQCLLTSKEASTV